MGQEIKRTARIWLGVGAAVAVGAGAAAKAEDSKPSRPVEVAQAAPHQHGAANQDKASQDKASQDKAKSEASSADQAKPDGEGEGADGGLDPRVRFYRDIGLIRGHLLVGDELVKAGRWDDASPHFLHPAEEIYENIAAALKRQNIRPFQSQLKALSQAVQAKKADAYATAWKAVDQRLTDAEKTVRKFVHNWPQFTMQTVMALLATAGSEYENAIEDGRISKPVEYQDSRGFVFWADHLLAGLPSGSGSANSESLAKAKAEVAELKKIWPTPMPPAAPVKDHSALMSDISRVELAAGPLLKP